ncbi:MAG: 50S ribosomal protein L29 [Anaerolineales bacterium]|nr:50S ribosomal protein L29 [Anaerolineales bacterium]
MLMSEIRALATPQIEAKLDDAREELFKLRFQFRTGQLTDYSRLRASRRTVARLATVVRERELAAQLAAQGEKA